MNHIRKIISSVAILLILAMAVSALGACSDENISYGKGKVMKVTGDVRIHRNGGSLPAYDGASIRNGDVIATDEESSVTLSFNGGKYAIIEPESKVGFEIYADSAGAVVLMTLHKGAIYTEADAPLSEGERYGIKTADLEAIGGGAVYRVAINEDKSARVNAIKGKLGVKLLNGAEEIKELSEWTECTVARQESDGASIPTYTEWGVQTDPYTLPDRYIFLGEDGVFDAKGNVLPKPLSADATMKDVVVLNADGERKPLDPELSLDQIYYTVECERFASITFTANHRRATMKIYAEEASEIIDNGYEVTLKYEVTEGEILAFPIVVDVIAENGDKHRISITVVTYEAPEGEK